MSSDKIIWYYEVLFWELYVKRNTLNPVLDSTGSPWREVDIGKMWALVPLSLLHGNPSNSWRDILVKTTIIKKVNLMVVPEEKSMMALSCEDSSSGHHRWTKRHGNPSKGCLDVSVCDKYHRQTNTDSQRRLSAGLYLIMFLICAFRAGDSTRLVLQAHWNKCFGLRRMLKFKMLKLQAGIKTSNKKCPLQHTLAILHVAW